MGPPLDPRLLVSFPPSLDPLDSTSIDMDVDPHKEIQDELWDPTIIEEEFACDSPQTPEVAPDIQIPGKAPPPSGLLTYQIQLVFNLRRDVVELLFGLEFLN